MNTHHSHHRRAGLFAGLAAGALVLIGASAAYAGCTPACTGKQICRYEAAGDYFYCADPVVKGKVAPGGSSGARIPTEPTAPSGASGRPAERVPTNPR